MLCGGALFEMFSERDKMNNVDHDPKVCSKDSYGNLYPKTKAKAEKAKAKTKQMKG